MKKRMGLQGLAFLLTTIVLSMTVTLALGASREETRRNAEQALENLYAKSAAAKRLAPKAKGILVFPNIVKAGFLFGGQIGDGVLLKNRKVAGYYNTVAASYGLQAGLQVYGYAMFFMNDKALDYLDSSNGWEVGVGPSVVVVTEGMGKSLTSTTISQDVYAFIFDQRGLMAGLGIQGSKITKLSD